MRRFWLLLILAPLLRAADYEVWFVAGQSNAQGWKGDAEDYPVGDPAIDHSIPLYYNSPGIGSSGGKWIALKAQKGRFERGHFGPEISFARKLAAEGRHPAIFKFSLGSTSLDGSWKRPGAGGLYDDMLAEWRRARQLMLASGDRPRLAGLIWIQGESDAIVPGMAFRYRENLERLIRHFRTKVAGNPKLPVILGVDEQHPMVRRRPIVLAAQKELADGDPQISFVPMRGLPKADSSHLTPQGLVSHGERLARAAEALTRGN